MSKKEYQDRYDLWEQKRIHFSKNMRRARNKSKVAGENNAYGKVQTEAEYRGWKSPLQVRKEREAEQTQVQ